MNLYELLYGRDKLEHCKFRYDPIPFTGVVCRGRGSYFKKPKTTQEIRLNGSCITDGFYVRSKRCFPNLPCAWDERVNSNLRGIGKPQTWKYNKKRKQWM